MIRFLGHLLRRLLLLGALGWVAWWVWPSLETLRQRFDLSGMADADLARFVDAMPDIAYPLEDERWIEFSIPGQGGSLKVVSNANLDAQQAAQPGIEWRYALHYQLVDGSGRLLKDAIYHHRTTVSWYRPPGEPRPLTAAFYLDRQIVPADGRVLMIDLAETPGAAWLRLGLASRAPEIESVVARVYTRQHLFDPPAALRWQRIARHQQEALARASIYGPELLRQSEQIQLLRQRWNPVGPIGIEGRDYRTYRLYGALNIEAEPLRQPVMPTGLYVDRDLRGTLPIPEPGGWVTLEFSEIDPALSGAGTGGAAAPAQAEAELVWHGRQPGPPVIYRVSLNGSSATLWLEKLGAGLLEVVAPRPLIVNAAGYWTVGEPLDLLPAPLYLRLYRLQPDLPLEFAIAHVDGQPTLWRVDLRLAAPGSATEAMVHYEWLDSRGATLRQGNLVPNGAASLYDRLLDGTILAGRVSEAATYGFALPATVARVRLTATAAPVLANAYTRPVDLRRELRAPEDYQPVSAGETRGQPVWFPVLPLAATAWMQDGRTVLLDKQTRPPQRDPEILAGRYDWEDYYPDGDWRGRYLLNPRDPQAPLRDLALGAVFQPLAAGTPVRLELRGPPGRTAVAPTFLVLRDTERPDLVQISVDGQPVFAEMLVLRRAQLRLPPLPVGAHTVLVQGAGPARWFVNYAGGGAGSLNRRLAYRLDREGLEFVYAKTSPDMDVLSGVLQTPFGTGRRARLRATVQMPGSARPGPFTRPTVREWLYDLRPDNGSPVPVLDTPTEQAGLGQRFFLPLGDDAPPGGYRIRLWLEEGSGYLTLYRVTPGLPAVLELFSEEGRL
ncbi:MAG TPA: hypothetical protein PKY50_18280 [Candidatus Competibacter sp.]|nr:hypothetical protein [Candidatus Competibacter sp.]